MFKQKLKYDQPDAQVRWFVAENVITTSAVTGSVSSEDFDLDAELIEF